MDKYKVLERLEAKINKMVESKTSGSVRIERLWMAKTLMFKVLKAVDPEGFQALTRHRFGRTTTKIQTIEDQTNVSMEYYPDKKRLYISFNGEDAWLQSEINRLLTKSGFDKLKKAKDEKNPVCHIRLFDAFGSATWWLYGYAGDDVFWCFADLGDSRFAECGTVSLKELVSLKFGSAPRVERDKYYTPKPLDEIMNSVKQKQYA